MAIESRYIELIKQGDVVAFPTETVYGLGADAWNPSAIQKVFTSKGRPSDNPLIVHVADPEQIHDFAADVPDIALKLIDVFWPGPLTIVFKKKPEVLDAVTAGLDTVAIRMPDHPLALEFITSTGPLVAPSANKSGKPSPTKADHVREDFGDKFPVLDGGSTRIGLESTVVDLSDKDAAILRPGSISRKQLEEVLGSEVEESFFHQSEKPRSPGQKYSHYKPKAEVRWYDGEDLNDASTLFLMLESATAASNVINYNGDLDQMARELYDRFRQADHEGFETVIVQQFYPSKESSVSSALYNRIERALS